MNSDIADNLITYRNFVVNRHRVWERRMAGEPAPWSDDQVLQDWKFTNVFRVLDHGSQFLLTELLNEPGITPLDVLARSFLYRMTNRPQVWERTKADMGYYPRAENMDADLADFWVSLRDNCGVQVFSGAYVIMPRPGVKGADKTRDVVNLAERYFSPWSGDGEDLIEDFLEASMYGRFNLLRSLPGVGQFLAMQILTDFGYSPYGYHQSENDFIAPGPGAKAGAKAIDPTLKPEVMIRLCQNMMWGDEDCPVIDVGNGVKRLPSLMDIQNTLCEFSKYVRYVEKPARVKPYRPEHTPAQLQPVFPNHWSR